VTDGYDSLRGRPKRRQRRRDVSGGQDDRSEGSGKTFLGHALGHIAARRRYSVLAETVDHLLESLRPARLDHSHEAELRKRLAVDLLLMTLVLRP
jgi:hypothetical protein